MGRGVSYTYVTTLTIITAQTVIDFAILFHECYCAYCDRKGHYKSNSKVLKEHEAKGCIKEEWLNKPLAERR